MYGEVKAVSLVFSYTFIQNEFSDTPLITACENDQPEVASFLIDNGASVNFQNKVFTYLHCHKVYRFAMYLQLPTG